MDTQSDYEVAAGLVPDPVQMRDHLRHLFGGDLDGCEKGHVELAWSDPVNGALKQAKLFRIDRCDELVKRAVNENSKRGTNVYIGVALRHPNTAPFGRCKDEDFYALTALYADIDHDVTKQALTICQDNGCLPTGIIVTGRHPHIRTQFLWQLQTPMRDPDQCRQQNRGIADALQADVSVVNPSRVLRLAGSIAWPIKKGRVVERTEFHQFDEDWPDDLHI